MTQALLELVGTMEHDQRKVLVKEYEDPDHPGYRIRRWEYKCTNYCWTCKIQRWVRELAAVYEQEIAKDEIMLKDCREWDEPYYKGAMDAEKRFVRELVGDER